MDSDAENRPDSPSRLKTLASCVEFPGGSTLLHRFVLDHSDSGGNHITGVLRSMSDASATVVNKLNFEGYSALHLAVLKNNLHMVRKILSCLHSVDVDCRCSGTKNTALHMAADSGSSPVVAELLEKGAGIELCNGDRRTALCLAAMSGHVDAMELLVSRGAKVDPDYGIRSPLAGAVRSGNFAAVAFLVDRGADVNARENSKHVLHIAASLETVELLVNEGGETDARRDRLGTNLLHEPNSTEVMMDRGYGVNGCDYTFGRTPLHFAVGRRNLEAVQLFVSRGANRDAVDRRGYTPLHHAVEETHLKVVEFLIDHGANLEAKELFGRKPLHVASMARNLGAVQLLIARGADVNATDAYGYTPLHHAVNEGCSVMAEFLVNHGGDFRAADDNGWTPLHIAACFGHVRIVRMLVGKGANVNARNKSFKTPLDLARGAHQNQPCMDALQNLGLKALLSRT